MLWTPASEFNAVVLNDTARPAAAWGVSITPGASNVKGSYTEILAGASLTFDAYAIEIYINSGGSAGQARDMLVDIGIDYAATSSFSVLIADLLAGNVSDFDPGNVGTGGHWFYFPLFIKAGAQLAARASVNNATAGSTRVFCRLFGKPKRPALVRAGSFVTTYGAVGASSSGAAVTPGQGSEGAWVDLAGADTTVPHWFWQVGIGSNNGNVATFAYDYDLGVGDGSNKQMVINQGRYYLNNSEKSAKFPHYEGLYEVAPGVRPYGRMQCSGAPPTGFSMTAYGVGGIGG